MKTKKLTAVLLSTWMFLSVFAACFGVSALQAGSIYPTIYVPGRNEDTLVNDVNAENPVNIRANISVDVGEFAKKLAPKITGAVFSGDWSDYCNTLKGLIYPMFSDVVLDKSGNVRDNSGVKFDFSTSTLRKLVQTDYTYKLDTYRFSYDYRIDPYENAEILNRYIECVKAVTKAKKVNLLGRCEGANIVLAYLDKYAEPGDINSCLFAWPSVKGLYGLTSFFTGKIALDMDAVDLSISTDSSVNEIASAVIQVMNMTGSLTPAANTFNEIYSEIESMLMPDMILNTFGNMPAFWAMLEPEYYDEAKAYVFAGREQEYAGLIQKIDYYHEHAALRVEEILREYTDAGMNFSCVTKYGYDASPICARYKNAQTDGMATVKSASLGATAANFGSVLSPDYIAARNSQGKGKYISPDKIIDASGCLYPDSTWFVKNAAHAKMPAALEDFCATLISKNTQPTVNDSSRYPQFMLYDGRTGSLVPLSTENDISKSDKNSSDFAGWLKSVISKITDFFNDFFEKIRKLFS